MKSILYALLLSLTSSLAFAEVYVIVHPDNANAISENDIRRIFLGKLKSFSDGKEAIPLNFSEGAELTNAFSSKALGKTPTQLKSYWSKLIFTGKGTPPRAVDSVDEIINLVSSNPNLIGYTDKPSDAVKVVATFP